MSEPINDGGPAFPVPPDSFGPSGEASRPFYGMSLRQYYAGQAFKGMLANPWTAQYLKAHFNDANVEGAWCVTQAVHAADALIAELSKAKP